MKIPLLIVGVFLTLSATSQAGPHGGRFGGGGFRGRFMARGASPGFKMGHGFHRDFANRRFFCHDQPIFFQQFAWPVYWYPYYDPLAYSYLKPEPDYQSASVQTASFGRAVDHRPIVVVVNTGNSQPRESKSEYIDKGYISTSAVGQQRMVVQDPNEKTGSPTDPITPALPAVPQATPAAAPTRQTALQVEAGVFGKLVLVSWLDDDGKDVLFVKNIETNDLQRITSQPNIDNFRIIEIHPNADPRQFEAVLSNGIEQGAIRFRF